MKKNALPQMGMAVTKAAIILVMVVCFSVVTFTSAGAEVPAMLGLGDSIGEGVQSGDASIRTQGFSYLKFIGKQIGTNLVSPWIQSGPLGIVGGTTSRTRLFPSVPGLNLAVSGADVDSLLNDHADALTVEEINSETDLVLFPRLGSQIEIAESLMPPFVVCWIGGNDVLSAGTSFDQLDASQMTPVADFEADFNEIAQRLGNLGGAVVFANIPDVTQIGFLVDRQDLIHFLGSDYGLAEGDYTSIVVMLLIRLGLDDGSLLDNPDFVLDADEVELVQERTAVFNQIIADSAANINMPVVDINGLFTAINENPPDFFGIPIRPRFLGGIFSLDGVHPSNIAHAIIANAFITKINSHFGTNIPKLGLIELLFVFLTDPFVDKDGDGVVTGRPLAGLLETFGPALGISGDPNDFDPTVFSMPDKISRKNPSVGQDRQFQGNNLKIDSELDKEKVLEVFRKILGPGN
jgi:lysophospholipase L1-like esterase